MPSWHRMLSLHTLIQLTSLKRPALVALGQSFGANLKRSAYLRPSPSNLISTFGGTIRLCHVLQLRQQIGPDSRDAEIFTDAWGWRELLQRNIDGSDCTDDGNAAALAEYEDLPGPWGTIRGGYQVTLPSKFVDVMAWHSTISAVSIRHVMHRILLQHRDVL